MKNTIFLIILKKYFPLLLMVLFIKGILTLSYSYCAQLDDLQEQVEKGNLPIIAAYMNAFKEYDYVIKPKACMAKAYADKGLDMIEHQGSFIAPPLTEKSFKDWLSAVADIYYYSAYFLYTGLCDTKIDFETAKKYLTITLKIKGNYLKEEEDASIIYKELDDLNKTPLNEISHYASVDARHDLYPYSWYINKRTLP